jgi:hypothetical protein
MANQFSFHRVPYHELSLPQKSDIVALEARYLEKNFPDRPAGSRAQLVGEMTKLHGNLKGGVGGALLRKRQSFARTVSVLAIEHTSEGERLAAHMTMGDNASSRPSHRWPVGSIERQLKLRVPEVAGHEFVRHRYIRLGFCAIRPDLQDALWDTSPQQANPVDAMTAYGTAGRDPRQPFAGYPWDEETFIKRQFASMGIEMRPGEDEDIAAFGPGRAGLAHQERWVGQHEEVCRRIAEKADAGTLLAAAGVALIDTDYGMSFGIAA